MSQEQQNTTWFVDYGLGGPNHITHQIKAAKPYYDERYYPTFVQLRNAEGDVVALIPINANPMLRRADTSPSRTPQAPARPAPPTPGQPPRPAVPRPPQTPATPASLQQLAERGAKPGSV
jgi:hypothetical protein